MPIATKSSAGAPGNRKTSHIANAPGSRSSSPQSDRRSRERRREIGRQSPRRRLERGEVESESGLSDSEDEALGARGVGCGLAWLPWSLFIVWVWRLYFERPYFLLGAGLVLTAHAQQAPARLLPWAHLRRCLTRPVWTRKPRVLPPASWPQSVQV